MTMIETTPREIAKFLKYCEKSPVNRINRDDWHALKKVSETEISIIYRLMPYNEYNRHSCLTTDIYIYPETYDKISNFMEGKKEMNMNISSNFSIDFGPVNSNDIAVSPYGIAVCSKENKWITYDSHTGKTIDVTGFTFDFGSMIYKIPCAMREVRTGDMILHQGKPVYVTQKTDNNLEVIDILDSEVKTIIPITNMFGFNFITKIMSLINIDASNPSNDQPFGNITPMIMASMLFGENNSNSNFDFNKLLMFSFISGANNPFASLFNFNLNNESKDGE